MFWCCLKTPNFMFLNLVIQQYNISSNFWSFECFFNRLCTMFLFLNSIQDGHFWGCSRMGNKKTLLPKICHTYYTMMKLGTVIPYLKKIQKIHKSRDTPPDFCWHQHFFHRKLANFVISRNTGIDWILVHKF